MRIIEWNINQATDISNNNRIPEFVVDEVINKNPDIFILTEFAKTINYEDIAKQINDKGFHFEVTNNVKCKQNGVLIAWKKDTFTLESNYTEKIQAHDEMPEGLIVPLKWKDAKIIVTGLRIKLCGCDYMRRKKQLENMMDLIGKKYGDCKYVIIGGDFNNNKSDYKKSGWKDKWSLGVIDAIAEDNQYIRKTPDAAEGSSIYRKNNDTLFQEDHYLVSERIKMNAVHYCRDFTKNHPDIYLHGEDFQVYNSQLRTATWEIPFGSGVPDHAMLIADFELLEKVEEEGEQKL